MGIPFSKISELNLYQKINSDNRAFLKSLRVILIILMLKVPLETQAQMITPSVLSSWSADVHIGTTQYSFSVGELAVSTVENGKIITQGFLQPQNFVPCQGFTLIGYPNPTTGILNFGFEGCDDKVGKVILMDLFGKIILKLDVTDNQIDLSDLKEGIYLLKAYNLSGSDVGTLKIARVSKL